MPKEYIGKRVDLIYDAENINIYYGLKLVTIHQRDDTPYTYTQKEAHGLPGHHGSYEKYLEEIYQRAGEIDYSISRDLNQNKMERLLSLDFVREGKNLFVIGSAGVGKSYIITATGVHACKNGFRTLYSNMSRLLGALKVAKTKGNLEAELKKIERCQLLILDDAFLVPLDVKERAILLDIIEDRHERKSIILSSQLPVSSWYDAIGDPTVADAVLDRIVHTAHQIELIGESVRKIKAGK